MTAWTIDTNAGPIARFTGTETACRTHVEEMIPLLRKRGYSAKWNRAGQWHVVTVLNSRGTPVHMAAFIDSRSWAR